MATTYDNASLVMIPSGIKESKLYSIKPTDGSGDFTFSRGTGTATRVNASGLIEKERSNQLLQSNTFDNAAWTLKRTGSNPLPSVTSGFIDPDGGTNAYRFQVTAPSADNDYSIISQTPSFSGVTGTPFVQSIYVKANGAGQIGKFFDLYAYQPSSSSYRSVENFELTGDWQRVELFHTFNATGSTMEIVFGKARSSAGGSTLANMATDVLIYSSQLEFGLAATSPVIETTTAAVYEGITDNLPRLDYSGGASCPSLLLEPSRTNIHTNSEYVDAYVKSRSTITTNAATSPEGVQNASKVIPLSTSTGWAGVNAPNYSFTSGQTYTLSVFAKAGEYNYCQVGGSTPAFNGSFATINLTNGVVEHQSGITASTEDYGNGWYRISFTHTAIATASSPIGFFAVYSTAVSSRLATQVGDDVSGVYMYGWQAEQGSYVSSYIPTYGTSASRAVDTCSKTGISSLIGQTEGTLFVEIDQPYADGVYGAWAISDGTSTNRITMNTLDVDATTFTFSIATNYAGGSTKLASVNKTYGLHKVAIQYSGTTLKLFVDGALADSVTTDGFGNFTNFYVGANQAGVGDEIREFKQALLFPTALTDTECIALTTI